MNESKLLKNKRYRPCSPPFSCSGLLLSASTSVQTHYLRLHVGQTLSVRPVDKPSRALAKPTIAAPSFRTNAGDPRVLDRLSGSCEVRVSEQGIESLDGLVSQWGNLSLTSDVEGSSYAFWDPEPSLSGGKQSAEFYLVGSMRAVENINPKLIEKAMSNAWSLRFGMEMKSVADNLYLFRFNHRLDINKVLREGPWRVKVYILVVKETLPDYLVSKEDLVEVPFWVQIYGIPPMWHREEVVRFVGNLIGRVIEIDPKVRRASPTSPMFIRVRVDINTMVTLQLSLMI